MLGTAFPNADPGAGADAGAGGASGVDIGADIGVGTLIGADGSNGKAAGEYWTDSRMSLEVLQICGGLIGPLASERCVLVGEARRGAEF